MPSAIRGGHEVHWREMGEGPRKALLLHCSLAHSGALRGLMEQLSDQLSMIAVDMPGHGRSADWGGDGPLQHAVAAIARDFIEEHDEPVDLIGHSFGGTSLLRVAEAQPERVRSLTLIEPPFFSAAYHIEASEMEEQERLDASFAEAFNAGRREEGARHFTQVWGAGVPWEQMTEDQRRYITDRIHLIEGGGYGLNDDYAGVMKPGRLERITAPVLLVHGTQSPPGIPAVLRGLHSRLPDSRIVPIEGAGHMAPITHPEAVGAAIREFLDRSA